MIKTFNVKIPLKLNTNDGYEELIDYDCNVKVKYENIDTDRGMKVEMEILEVNVLDVPEESELTKQAFEYVYLKPWVLDD